VKVIALFLLVAWIIAVHRYARQTFVVLYCIALVFLYFSLAGCATERPSPGPAPTGELCGDHDGTYQLLNCKRYFP
jgi:hypothetical protein